MTFPKLLERWIAIVSEVHCIFPLPPVTFVEDEAARTPPRNFAFYMPGEVRYSKDMLKLRSDQIEGILWHEAMHMVDHVHAPLKTPYDAELRADELARRFFGVEILYCGPHLVQCLRCGIPRPAGLR